MNEPRYWEDYVIGESRRTLGRTITETDVVMHAGQTGDFFPHHVDAEFAASGEFGERIAHGTLIFSVGIGLTAASVNPVSFSYGYNRLRFVRPVFIGDTISTQVTIIDKQPDPKRPGQGRIVERCEVTNQRRDLVLICDHILLVEQKPASS